MNYWDSLCGNNDIHACTGFEGDVLDYVFDTYCGVGM